MKQEKEILAVYDSYANCENEIKYRLEEKQNELTTLIEKARSSWKTLDKSAMAEVSKHFFKHGAVKMIVNFNDYMEFLIDHSDLAEFTHEIEYRGKKKIEIDEEKINKDVYEDYDLDSWHFDDFIESLNMAVDELKKESGCWRVEGRNLDWQGRGGYKYFQAENGKELFEAIKPNTSELTAYFYKGKRNTIEARISHHDCPTGSYYLIKPITQKEYDKEI